MLINSYLSIIPDNELAFLIRIDLIVVRQVPILILSHNTSTAMSKIKIIMATLLVIAVSLFAGTASSALQPSTVNAMCPNTTCSYSDFVCTYSSGSGCAASGSFPNINCSTSACTCS